MAEIINQAAQGSTGSSKSLISSIINYRLWILSGLVPPLGLLVTIWLWLAKKLRRLALATLAVSIVCVAIYAYLYRQHYGSNKYDYKYKALSASQIVMSATNVASATVNIQKPPELAVVLNPVNEQVRAYRHDFKDQPVANLSMAVTTYTGDYGKLFKPVVVSALKKASSNTDYQAVNQQLISYLQTQFSNKTYTLNLNHAQTLSTHYITADAWQFDVSAAKTVGAKAYQKWQGKLLYIWTGSHVYYILIDTIQQNWRPNQAVWQQMVNTLRVD